MTTDSNRQLDETMEQIEMQEKMQEEMQEQIQPSSSRSMVIATIAAGNDHPVINNSKNIKEPPAW